MLTHRLHWPTADSALAVALPAAIALGAMDGCWIQGRDKGIIGTSTSALFAMPVTFGMFLFFSDGDEAGHPDDPCVEAADWDGRSPPAVCCEQPKDDECSHDDCNSSLAHTTSSGGRGRLNSSNNLDDGVRTTE
jgi:hypothetical protein